jgi:hypothetical protein
VRSFYNNIRDPKNAYDDITVDSHAFSIALGKKYGSGSVEYNYFAGASWKHPDWTKENPLPPLHKAVNNATVGLSGLYPAFADSYRRVAAKHGLTARQMQAVTWVQWRNDHPDVVRAARLRGE